MTYRNETILLCTDTARVEYHCPVLCVKSMQIVSVLIAEVLAAITGSSFCLLVLLYLAFSILTFISLISVLSPINENIIVPLK